METVENIVKKENKVLMVSSLVVTAITIGGFLLFFRFFSSLAHGIEIAEFLKRNITDAMLAAIVTFVAIVVACAISDILREGMIMLILETAAVGTVIALTFSWAVSVYLAGAGDFFARAWFLILPAFLATFLFVRIWHGEETFFGRLSLIGEIVLIFAVVTAATFIA